MRTVYEISAALRAHFTWNTDKFRHKIYVDITDSTLMMMMIMLKMLMIMLKMMMIMLKMMIKIIIILINLRDLELCARNLR